MFLSNLGLTLNLEVQYPTAELIYVFAFLESMSYILGGLFVGRFYRLWLHV